MSGTVDRTVLFAEGEEGWVIASILAVPGALGQGRSREEARENAGRVGADAFS